MKNNNDDMWNVGNAQIYNDDDGGSISQNGKGFFEERQGGIPEAFPPLGLFWGDIKD